MPREVKKFLVIFSGITIGLIVAAGLITLFATDHWIIGLCLGIPTAAASIAAAESDIISAVGKKIINGDG